MKLSDNHITKQIMTESNNSFVNFSTNISSMEKMKKLLSPGTRKKSLAKSHRTFGIPLEELVARAPAGNKVPYVVSRICEYIQYKGYEHEGLFRVNGSTRLMEKLRTSFDQRGDADFDEEEDIMAVAGLLKLFLRELPGALIPEHRTKQFVSIQEVYMNDPESCIHQLREAIRNLPGENYNLLRYLVRFLVVISQFEKKNKMHPMALAIVFGPNVFKCGQGILGLKDQGTVNQIVYKFLTNYDLLFKEEGEESPQEQWIKKKQKAPPRPPPPMFHVEEYNPTSYPGHHKIKTDVYDNSQYLEQEEGEKSEESSSHTLGRGSNPSPMFSDEEIAGRASPFVLDSDGGYSIIESPVPSARTTKAVEKVITQAITETLFGDNSHQSSVDYIVDLPHGKFVGPATLIGMTEQVEESKENLEVFPVKERMKTFEVGKNTSNDAEINKPSQKLESSGAFDLFESEGIIITQTPKCLKRDDSAYRADENKMTCVLSQGKAVGMETDNDDDFEIVKRDFSTLSSLQFKKPSGPRNRRSPSRKSRSNLLEEKETEKISMEGFEEKNDNQHDIPIREGEISPPHPKPRVAFLELTNNQTENRSPDVSPNSSRKPLIPPLDLSTLHEHIDSADPILAHKGQSVSYQRAKSQLNGEETADALISPRNTKLIKRKSHSLMNTDVPPSPPVEQEHFRKQIAPSMDDDISAKMKQQTKKVHALKKKLKQFEELFEKENGFKPSHSDKSNKPTVKRWMSDLSKAKKEIKKLKEEAEMGSRSRHGSGASSSGERLEPPEIPPTMNHTLDIILRRLEEKRKECNRPEDIDVMTYDQVLEEKLAVQKALLHFENIHGRPKLREEKDLMRPLYDRYRSIKRIIAQPRVLSAFRDYLTELPDSLSDEVMLVADLVSECKSSYTPREKTELQIIHEDQELNSDDNNTKPIIPSTGSEEQDKGTGDNIDFIVTRDFSLYRHSIKPLTKESDHSGHSPKVKRKLQLPHEEGEEENREEGNTPTEQNLHEMTIPELQDEFIRCKGEKKRLRRKLRTFEEEFLSTTGRRVEKEDREPLQMEYSSYKQIKAKLKLMEALLSKFQLSSEA